MDIATPVMAVCLMVTTTETVDGSYSTVATRELKACAVCNAADCPKPEWFDQAVKISNTINKPLPTAKQKRRIGRK